VAIKTIKHSVPDLQ